jgi:hypothetical protein
MSYRLYFDGEETVLKAGDVVKRNSSHNLTFHRNGRQMLLSDHTERKVSAKMLYTESRETFFNTVTLVTGLKFMETDSKDEYIASVWELV